VRYLFVLLFLVWPWIGAGVETLVFLEEPSAAKAVDMIRTGALDLYGAGVTEPTILQQIQSEPNLTCSSTYNAVWHLSFNPIGPTFTDGRLNPFFDPRAREAINWLVDRDYIVQEILGGAGFPQVLPLRPLFPDYARLAQYARPLELRYQYDPERARNVLSEVLFSLGAEFVDGKWTYQGKPIELRILIRTDSRRPLGDYLAGLLEGLGFTVTRIYASYAEALRILSSPPEEGLWHIYTNSLVVSLIERDEASTFQLNYTPAFPYPPWEYLRPNPELADLADRLAHGLYSSLEEREALMARALELAMKDSSQVWLAVRAACYPHASDLNFAVDLAAGLATGIWAHTLSSPKETIRIAVPALLAAPLNPVAGSFTVYDQMIIRATADPALIPHPYSGLYLPVDLVRAEVEAEEGSPIQKSLDWVELRFVPEITVPKEAWLDWDAKAMRFLTVGEVKPQGLKAKARVILHFRPDLWEKTWHDGSPFSLGDFLVRLILLFDRAKPESSVYDESAVPALNDLQAHFKGILIRGVDPLVVEVYTDLRLLDAEWLVAKAAELIYPFYEQGPGPWHVLAVLLWAEAHGEIALSQAKAKSHNVEWAGLLSGPSLGILAEALQKVKNAGFLPYADFLGNSISADERDTRYENLSQFYKKWGHFWVGNGPFYLELVKPVEKVLVLRRWPGYKEPEANLADLAKIPLPEVEVEGPQLLDPGQSAIFTVTVGFDHEIVSPDQVLFVKYFLFDSLENLVSWGVALPSGEGFRLELQPEILGKLRSGPARLEVVASLVNVAIPAWRRLALVVLGPGG